jgi:endoglucanase
MMRELQTIASDVYSDKLGSIVFEFYANTQEEEKPVNVLLVGHMDEIGFMVHSIRKNGLINFTNLGGWDPRTLMSSPVEIVNRDGKKVTGVIASVPVHHLVGASSNLTLSDLYIDIGAESDEEVAQLFRIRKGCLIIPIPHYHYIEEKECIISKAFDDRVGIAVAIEAGRHFHKSKHPNNLQCAGSVQEEVGTRGAQTLTNLMDTDIAIVIEGAPGDDFPSNRDEPQAKMNGGVQIRMLDPTMICNPRLANFVIDLAEELKIPHQIAVRKSGGTDAGKIHLADVGIPTIVLAAPVRYAHSHNGILSLHDYRAVRQLAFALIERIDRKLFGSFL